jgi:hypothetical protein
MKRHMFGIDAIFVAPWFLLMALVVAVGVWRGQRKGLAAGLSAAAITGAFGLVVLVVLFVALTFGYYLGGGH